MRAILGLIRPFTLLAPAVGVASGVLVASAATDQTIEAGALLCGVAAALFATVASNAWNQVFDVDIDRVNKPERPIPAGAISARSAMAVGGIGAPAALVLAWFASTGYVIFVALGLLLTWIYSAPPLRTKRSAFGALLTIAIARGLLVPAAGWAIVAPVDTVEPWFLGAVVGLFVFGAAATKDFTDVEGDRAHGIRTLPVLYGSQKAARMIAPFLFLPFLLYPLGAYAGWLQPPVSAFALLAAALVLPGTLAAWLLLVKPSGGAGAGNHPAWTLMYLLMLGAHGGVAVVYRVSA